MAREQEQMPAIEAYPLWNREMVSLALATFTPVLGVLLLGWDVHAAMFLLSCEVIATSILLGWLFNYPDRSPLAGALLVLVMAPASLLMWVVLAKSYAERRGTVAMVVELMSETWFSVLFIVAYAAIACRSRMAHAAKTGTSIRRNDRILINWILQVFIPFAVFAWIMAGWKTLGTWGLAVMLAVTAVLQLVAQRRETIAGSTFMAEDGP